LACRVVPVQLRAENLEVHRRRESQKLIAKIAQPPQAQVDIK
jgi:hypothetical protein